MNLMAFNIGDQFWLKKDFGITDPDSGYSSLGQFLSNLLPNVYVFAGLILFFLLIGGGITFIVSAGSDNPEGAAKGKKAITSALVGFLIIFASYWIIQLIEVITGLDILHGLGGTL